VRSTCLRDNILRTITSHVLVIILFCLDFYCIPADAFTIQGNQQSASQRKTKVDLKYEKSKDLSTARLNLHIWEGLSKLDSLDLDVSFTYPGHIITTPSAVRFVFYGGDDPAFGYDDDPTLVFNLDGARMDLGKMKQVHHSQRTEGEYVKSTFQVFDLSVPYEKVVQMVKANRIKIDLSGRKFDLSSKNLQALRDFVQLMQQSGQEFK
jgi:hypothetical protein